MSEQPNEQPAEQLHPQPHRVHEATDTEASNGKATADAPRDGETLDRPILDGSTETYEGEGERLNPRYGMEDPGLIRHPETGEKTPVPDEEA